MSQDSDWKVKFFSRWQWVVVIALLFAYISIYGNHYLPQLTHYIDIQKNGIFIESSNNNECKDYLPGYIKTGDGSNSDIVKVRKDKVSEWLELPVDGMLSQCRNILGNLAKTQAQQLSTGAKVYIGLVFFLIILYMVKEAAVSKKLAEKEKNLNDAILTTPPYEVTREFQKVIKLMAQYEDRLKNKTTEAELSEQKKVYIRFCLDSIARIAKYFHNASDGHRFAANIMGVVETKVLLQNHDTLINLATFSEYNSPSDILEHEPKFLRLIHELSSATDDEVRHSIDHGMQNEQVLLPLPTDRKKALPGAPAAYLSYSMHDLITNCKISCQGHTSPHISSKVKSALNHYFNEGQGKSIGSVLSIRLSDENDDQRIGVVNIHSDLEEIFVNSDKRMMFIQLISPVLYKIYKLLR